MKKTIISLLSLIACISVDAQTIKIYKGTTLVAEYTADQADNVVFSKDNSEQSTTKKYVLESLQDVPENGSQSTSNYTYDEQGRLISHIVSKDNKDDTYTYTYSEQQIIMERVGTLSKNIYTLNDKGLIVKEEFYTINGDLARCGTYEYDEEGKLASTSIDGKAHYIYRWQDGDMVKLEQATPKENVVAYTEFTPSELTADYGQRVTYETNMNENLFMKGYYGKLSKHLPAKELMMNISGAITSALENNYTYTITDGCITGVEANSSLTSTPLNIKKETTNNYTFVWKEIE